MPAEAPAAPAPSPSPAPAPEAAAAAPEKGTPPSPSPGKTVDAPFNDAFAELDKFSTEENAEPGGKTPEAKEPKPEPEPEQEPEPLKAKETPKQATPPKPVKAADLRAAKDAAEKRAKELEAKVAELEKKVSSPTKPEDLPEFKTVQERLTAAEKRRAELEDEIRYSAYERSEEYKEKYEKPFLDAYKTGVERVSALKTVERKNEDVDSPDFDKVIPGRQGTPEDFATIMRITEDDAAAEKAFELFGNKAPMVLFHRERVQETLAARNRALEEFRTKGSEREKEMQAKTEAQRKELATIWDAENKAAVEKFPQWFKPEDGDEAGNKMLEQGYHLADRAFSNGQPIKDGDKPLSPQEMVKLHSAIRNKAGAFDRLALKHHQLGQRVKELETKLAQYEASEPKGGDGKGQKGAEGESTSPDAAFDNYFRKKR